MPQMPKPSTAADLWVGMPEFVQERQTPAFTLTVRFETEQDLLNFQDALGQKLTPKTRACWYPKRGKSDTGAKRWF
jgi:hypothetical protein